MIDDSQTVLNLCAKMLAGARYQPLLMREMEDALEVNARDQVDVILVDLVMPGMDGITGIQAIRKADPNARIIAMSGGDASQGSYELLRKARRAGADALLQKPFEEETLLEVVADVQEHAGTGKLNVLAIDDSRTICKAIEEMLGSDWRFRVTTATSADEALASPHVVGVDVIVTDIFMPGESGIDVINKVRDNWPDVRVIAMSASYGDDPETQEKALRAAQKIGARATIEKPFKKRELIRAITDVSGDLVG